MILSGKTTGMSKILLEIKYIDNGAFKCKSALKKFAFKECEYNYVFGEDRTKISREDESLAFLRMNFAKSRASRPRTNTDDWLKKAQAIKDYMGYNNVPLALFWVNKYSRSNVQYESLVSEAFFGLNNAIDKFDASKNIKFSTYASTAIWRRLSKYSKDEITYRSRNYQSDDEYSNHMAEYSDDHLSDGVVVSDHETQSDAASDIYRMVVDNTADLDYREKAVILGRFGLTRDANNRSNPRTLQSMGDELNVCKERIRQIELLALEKLRIAFEEENENTGELGSADHQEAGSRDPSGETCKNYFPQWSSAR
jgi:RNA polymerase sigma factor (sigma-70 family)